MRPAFYQPSGRIPLLVFPALLACLCLAVAGALAYAWMSARAGWCLSSITLVVFCFWLDLIVKTAGRLAKVRNPVTMKEFGIVVGLFGWASQWLFWIAFAAYQSASNAPGHAVSIPIAGLLAHPSALWEGFQAALAATGWGEDMDVDLLRCLGWLVECSLLLTVACDAGRRQAGMPFCEASDRWASVTRLPYRFAVGPLLQVRAEFIAHPEQVLEKLSLKRAHDRFASATLYSGKYEDFMSVDLTEWAYGHGRRKKEESVVKYLHVPRGAVERMLERLARTPRKAKTVKAKARRGQARAPSE